MAVDAFDADGYLAGRPVQLQDAQPRLLPADDHPALLYADRVTRVQPERHTYRVRQLHRIIDQVERRIG